MNPFELSGWILPSGEYQEVEEWWHVSHLYDLKKNGLSELCLPEQSAILDRGDESEIRDMAARIGFVKLSRGEIDAYSMNALQLSTLQDLLELCDPDYEFRILVKAGESIKTLSISRILKLKSPKMIFE